MFSPIMRNDEEDETKYSDEEEDEEDDVRNWEASCRQQMDALRRLVLTKTTTTSASSSSERKPSEEEDQQSPTGVDSRKLLDGYKDRWTGTCSERLGYGEGVVQALERRIDAAQRRCEQKSQVLVRLRGEVRELESDRDALADRLEHLRAQVGDAQHRILRESELGREYSDEAESVLRKQQTEVMALKHQISLYASCTGIKWDYDTNEDGTLEGQVVRSRYLYLRVLYVNGCQYSLDCVAHNKRVQSVVIASLKFASFSNSLTGRPVRGRNPPVPIRRKPDESVRRRQLPLEDDGRGIRICGRRWRNSLEYDEKLACLSVYSRSSLEFGDSGP